MKQTAGFLLRRRRGLIAPSKPATAIGRPASFSSCALYPCGITVPLLPIQPGSGDPSPTNIRPISGRTGLTVSHAGKNLASLASPFTGTANTTIAEDLPPGDYIVSMYLESVTTTGSGIRLRVRYTLDGTTETITGAYGSTAAWVTMTFTIPEGATDIIVDIQKATAVSTFTVSSVQVEAGSTRTTYEPTRLRNIAVTWPGQGMVYAGSYNTETKQLTITHAGLVLTESSGTWGRQAANNPNGTVFRLTRSTLADDPAFPDTSTAEGWSAFDAICSHFVKSTARAVTTLDAGSFFVRATHLYFVYGEPNQGTTLPEFKTWLTTQETANTPLTLVGELAEPVNIDLNGAQTSALPGLNQVWSDVGNVEVTYKRFAWEV